MDANKLKIISDVVKSIVFSVAAGFGVWTYFDDNNKTRNNKRIESSLSYISDYRSNNLLESRKILFRFWNSSYADVFLKAIQDERVFEASAGRFFDPIIKSKSDSMYEVVESIFLITDFFDEVWFCRYSDNCDAVVLDGFYCEEVRILHNLYNHIYNHYREELYMSSLAYGLNEYRELCANFVSGEPS